MRDLLALFCLLFLLAASFAAEQAAIQVSGEVDDDLIEPGDSLNLIITISNTGEKTATRVSYDIITPSSLSVVTDNWTYSYVGAIGGGGSQIVTIPLLVSKTTLPGKYVVNIIVNYLGEGLTRAEYNQVIEIKHKSNVQLVDIKELDMVPGSSFNASFMLRNDGEDFVNDITLELNLSGTPIISLESGIQQFYSKLAPGTSKVFEFPLKISKNAEVGDSYNIPLSVFFTSQFEKEQRVLIDAVGVNVLGEGRPSIADVDTLPKKISPGDFFVLEITVQNVGTDNLDDVEVVIDVPFLGVQKVFLGVIKTGADKIATFDLRLPVASEIGLHSYPVAVVYEDDFGRHEFKKEFQIFFSEIPETFSEKTIYSLAILLLGLFLVATFFFKKR